MEPAFEDNVLVLKTCEFLFTPVPDLLLELLIVRERMKSRDWRLRVPPSIRTQIATRILELDVWIDSRISRIESSTTGIKQHQHVGDFDDEIRFCSRQT